MFPRRAENQQQSRLHSCSLLLTWLNIADLERLNKKQKVVISDIHIGPQVVTLFLK